MATTNSTISPPPTYAPLTREHSNGDSYFNPVWLQWLLSIADQVVSSTQVPVHNTLSGLQGGVDSERYHLPLSVYTSVTNGLPVGGVLKSQSTIPFNLTGTLSNGAGVATGTLTNAPVAGNPAIWLVITTDAGNLCIPAWSAL